jgi:hypothetical protein
MYKDNINMGVVKNGKRSGIPLGEGVEIVTRSPDGFCGGYPIEKPADEWCLPEQGSSLF